MIALSLANLTVADAGPLELLDAAVAGGFASVNMWLVPPPAMAAFSLKCGATAPVTGDSAMIRAINARTVASGVSVSEASCGWLTATFDRSATAPVLDTMAQIGTRRVSVVGWDADRARLTANLAAVCADAAAYGMTVSLEFMPYSAVRTVADTAALIADTGAANLHVLVDALHLARSGGTPADLRLLDPHRLGVVQLCDAPAAGPPADRLRDESVNRRLYPGDGELPLEALLDALPRDVVIEIESPSVEHASASIAERARLCARRSRRFLEAYQSRRAHP